MRNYLPNLKVATVTSVPIRPITEPPFIVIYRPERNKQKIPLFNEKKEFAEKLSGLSE